MGSQSAWPARMCRWLWTTSDTWLVGRPKSKHTIPISVPYTPGARISPTRYVSRRRGGPDHPMEFPAAYGGLETRTSVGRRLHHRPEACRADTAVRLTTRRADLRSGIPGRVINIVTGYGETAGAALAAHPDVDKVAFTGSTEVGKLILRAAAGISRSIAGARREVPNIVCTDADLEASIPGVASAIFFNQGQCCCVGSRLFVEKGIFDKVVEGVAEDAKKIKAAGHGSRHQMGPLVSDEQQQRVLGYLESGLSEGAKRWSRT